MTLSRSPSPNPRGAWSGPGLNLNDSGRSSPARGFSPSNSGTSTPWEPSLNKMGTFGLNSYPSFSTQNQGFFQRHMRRISSSLPKFNPNHNARYAEKEKLGRARWMSAVYKVPVVGRIARRLMRSSRKTKTRLMILFFILFCIFTFYNSPLVYHWRRTAWLGGGEKFVIILAANVGGGVTQWKGAREWAIERDSIRNKKKYVGNWGYDLEIVDMSTKKKYAHEWRQGWEKADHIRNTFRKYPDAEWVWWLDLTSMLMEPKVSLQKHIFDNLADNVYRDINEYNPLNLTHPFEEEWLDEISRSPVGDGKPESINMLLTQDCDGFNLASFFMRRSDWSDQLLDMWWDPVKYEQKHMQWSHKEQDAFQELYTYQPWVRKHTAFLPQRMINSFPPAACPVDKNDKKHVELDPRFHYHQADRDFMMTMAGCEWGRDCWGEMYRHRQLSYWLNRSLWERFKEDLVAVAWFKITGHKVRL